jgi:hypothetical protein
MFRSISLTGKVVRVLKAFQGESNRAARYFAVVKTLRGGREHPVSEAQRRWAWSAEERGELPPGKAHEWSQRVKGKKLPEHTEDFKPVKKAFCETEEEHDWNIEHNKNKKENPARRMSVHKAFPHHSGRPGQRGGSTPQYYVGHGHDGKREVFQHHEAPTQESHGDKYAYSIGPFKTKGGANIMAERGNPQTVHEAEQIAERRRQQSKASRQSRADVYDSLGMKKVRGSRGGTYWE